MFLKHFYGWGQSQNQNKQVVFLAQLSARLEKWHELQLHHEMFCFLENENGFLIWNVSVLPCVTVCRYFKINCWIVLLLKSTTATFNTLTQYTLGLWKCHAKYPKSQILLMGANQKRILCFFFSNFFLWNCSYVWRVYFKGQVYFSSCYVFIPTFCTWNCIVV